MKLFTAETYKSRREKLKELLGIGQFLFLGNQESPMNYRDNTYSFRQDSTFAYFFGLQIPQLAVIYDAESGEFTLYGNDFTLDDIIWMGPQSTMQELAEKIGLKQTKAYQFLLKDLRTDVQYLPPYRHDNILFLSEFLSKNSTEVISSASVKMIQAVVALRSLKTEEEIHELEKAINITRDMHLAAMKAVKAGKKEYEIVAEIKATALKQHAELSYPAICTIHGETLHNHYHGNTLQNGLLFLNDSGAQTDMLYAGDITRTLPVSGTFSTKQKDMYTLVLKMEVDAIHALKSGVQYREIHLLANQIMLEGLKELHLVKGDTQEMLELGVGGLFMPHGLGHMIGMDVHDMEDLGEKYVGYREGLERSTQLGLKSLRLAKELEVGNVLTVEPGIYFIPALLHKYASEGIFKDFVNYAKLEEYHDFGGIRIEDNVLITKDGSQILGKPIPKTVEEVEEVMGI